MEQQAQQQKPQYVMPLFQDASQRNLIRDILNPEDILVFIENTLKGNRLDEDNKWVADTLARSLNPIGIYKTLQVLRGHLNKYQTLANLELADIIRMGRAIRLEIVETIYMNWEEFNYLDDKSGKPDLSSYNFIVNLIDHNVFANLTRAKGGGESKLLRTVYRSHEAGMERTLTTENPQKKNL